MEILSPCSWLAFLTRYQLTTYARFRSGPLSAPEKLLVMSHIPLPSNCLHLRHTAIAGQGHRGLQAKVTGDVEKHDDNRLMNKRSAETIFIAHIFLCRLKQSTGTGEVASEEHSLLC